LSNELSIPLSPGLLLQSLALSVFYFRCKECRLDAPTLVLFFVISSNLSVVAIAAIIIALSKVAACLSLISAWSLQIALSFLSLFKFNKLDNFFLFSSTILTPIFIVRPLARILPSVFSASFYLSFQFA